VPLWQPELYILHTYPPFASRSTVIPFDIAFNLASPAPCVHVFPVLLVNLADEYPPSWPCDPIVL
jgi:hypothetical protein